MGRGRCPLGLEEAGELQRIPPDHAWICSVQALTCSEQRVNPLRHCSSLQKTGLVGKQSRCQKEGASAWLPGAALHFLLAGLVYASAMRRPLCSSHTQLG